MKKKQNAIALPNDLRAMVQSAADEAEHSFAEEVRQRLWFSFYKNADQMELQTAEHRIIIIDRTYRAWSGR